jgi:VWFA-related protein
MVFGRQSIGAGVLAMALAGAGSADGGQQAPQQNPTQTAQQQSIPNAPSASIPNAPTPQGLPNLNTITPPAPMAPEPARSGEANPDAADAKDNGGVTPTDHLPSTSSAQPGQQTGAQEPGVIIPAAGKGAQEAYTLGVRVDFVQIPFTVKDSKGHFVPDLTPRDVRIFENGLRQQMRFWTSDPYPLSVAFVIDQSVTQDTMDKINSSLSALQGAFAPYDEVAVYTYNNGVTLQTTFTAAQSNRLGVILERSKGQGRETLMGEFGPLSQTTTKNNQQVDPNTAPQRNQLSMIPTIPKEYHLLYDALFAAAQDLAKVDAKRRRVLYVVSDGKEYGSKVKEKELIHYLQTNKISVYATLVGDSSIPGMGFLDRIHLPLTMRDDALPRIAAATGGQCDPEFRPRGIENSFADITKTVRTLYNVGYYTHESPLDGRFRHVEVRVMRPGLTVVAPDGYYPSPRNVHQAQPVAGADQTPPPDNQPAPPPANPPSDNKP